MHSPAESGCVLDLRFQKHVFIAITELEAVHLLLSKEHEHKYHSRLRLPITTHQNEVCANKKKIRGDIDEKVSCFSRPETFLCILFAKLIPTSATIKSYWSELIPPAADSYDSRYYKRLSTMGLATGYAAILTENAM